MMCKGMFLKLLKKKREKTQKTSSTPQKEIICSGAYSHALSACHFPIPVGKCSNPESTGIKEEVRNDVLGQLLDNPITSCIFCDKGTMNCFFSKDCKRKIPISEKEVEEYRIQMKARLEENIRSEDEGDLK